MPWGVNYGLIQQQQQQQQQQQSQQNGAGGSGSTTPGPNGRRPGSPSSGATTNGTVTPGPPELQNGGLPATNGATPAGVPPIHLFPAAATYIDPASGAFLRGPTPPQGAAGLRLVHPTQGPFVANNGLAVAAGVAGQPPNSLGFGQPNSTTNINSISGNGSASRRESMDRGSSTFSPSLLDQYKNKAGWPANYTTSLGAGKFSLHIHLIIVLYSFFWKKIKSRRRVKLIYIFGGNFFPPLLSLW